MSLAYSKDPTSETLKRRPSYGPSLTEALAQDRKAASRPVTGGPTSPGGTAAPQVLRGGWLQKRSTTGKWSKRYFVVHGHYLSYFRQQPGDGANLDKTLESVAGVLDMWHVQRVSLDEQTITLELSDEASVARRENMGSRLIRESKKRLAKTSGPGVPLVKGVVKELEKARRGTSSPRVVLRAANSAEAQMWLVEMTETPLMGSLASLRKALREGGGVAGGAAGEQPPFEVRNVRLSVPPSRELAFHEGSAGVSGTRIIVRDVPRNAFVQVTADVGQLGGMGKPEAEGSTEFNPTLREEGVVVVPVSNAAVEVHWRRQADGPTAAAMDMLPKAGAAALLVLIVVKLVLGVSFAAALVAATAVGAAPVVQAGLAAREGPVSFAVVDVSVARSEERALEDAERVEAEVSARRGRRRGKRAQRRAAKKAELLSKEDGQLRELRARVQDLYKGHSDPKERASRDKKFAKIFREWGADVSATDNLALRKAVLDKHVGVDWRLVRYLRARDHNMDKAEAMVRDAMEWRIVLELETLPDRFTPPQWIIDYMGCPAVQPLLLPVDEHREARIETWWERDLDGHLCVFFRNGPTDARKIFKKVDSNATYLVKMILWVVEFARRDLDRVHEMTGGKVLSKLTVVTDLDGFSLSQQLPLGDAITLARRYFPIIATAFPELLNRVLIVNAPWLFNSLYNAVKPFIPEEVVDKIRVHGSVNLERDILPFVARSRVPAFLGGDRTDDGDPDCSQTVPPRGPFLPDKGASLLAR